MRDHYTGCHPALTELRSRLNAGMARLRLNQTDLAGKAGLGRTTVSEALQAEGTAPSPKTVTALAVALKLPTGELLELLRTAAKTGAVGGPGPGRSIGEWEPHDLEVHPAGAAPNGQTSAQLLPGYIFRAHDQVLADAVQNAAQGRSRMAVLVGTSSTGKTRACWEAIQPLAQQGWRLWHPFDPTRAEAALEDLHQVGPRTVVWLNEAQHYLGPLGIGERIAAAIHHLLVQPERGPILILGTLWPKFEDQYTALPTPGDPDPHSRVRELLAGRTVTVPEVFDAQAMAAATELADRGDPLLADALTRARANGRLTQDLAGAPALLKRYEHGSPSAKALLEVAMDARRLDVGLHLPQAFLTEAATDYFNDTDYDQRPVDWAEAAYAELARSVHGEQTPLRRTSPRPQRRPPAPSLGPSVNGDSPTGPVFRLADYLEQHGRNTRKRLCPPASFWHAAYLYLTQPEDLGSLSEQAMTRHRLQWAHHLRVRAAELGNAPELRTPVRPQTGADGREGEEMVTPTVGSEGAIRPWLLTGGRSAPAYQEGAEASFRQADRNPLITLRRGSSRGKAGGGASAADPVEWTTADGGTTHPTRITQVHNAAEDPERPGGPKRIAVDGGDDYALLRLAVLREESGDREGAETLIRQAADRGATYGLLRLAELREKAGDREGAEALARQAADRGATYGLLRLAELREKAGDREGAEILAWHAADCGDESALFRLAELREWSGGLHAAEILYREIAATGSEMTFFRARIFHAIWPHGLDPDGAPTPSWQ
ncbi:helix-turn-helix transcriptional regulator [Streptomyces atroolivaceus]|uniref:helix-turn-helix transcriptional regulator n=1 Tax=Streptomyces atroolivaceus TaxID=66869 RepID=UPI003422E85C